MILIRAAPLTRRACSASRMMKVIIARMTTGCVRSPKDRATFLALAASNLALRRPITARNMPTPALMEILIPLGMTITMALRIPRTVTRMNKIPLKNTIALAILTDTCCNCTKVIENMATLPIPGARTKGRFVYRPMAIVVRKIMSTIAVRTAIRLPPSYGARQLVRNPSWQK